MGVGDDRERPRGGAGRAGGSRGPGKAARVRPRGGIGPAAAVRGRGLSPPAGQGIVPDPAPDPRPDSGLGSGGAGLPVPLPLPVPTLSRSDVYILREGTDR